MNESGKELINEGIKNDNKDSRDPVENLCSADLYYIFSYKSLLRPYVDTCRHVSAPVWPYVETYRNMAFCGDVDVETRRQ